MGRYDHVKIESSVKKQFSLEGKRAIITGGGGFLGLQFAESLGEMGAEIVLVDISEEGLQDNSNSLKEKDIKNSFVKLDLTSPEEISEKIGNILHENQVQVLVNGAAFAMKNLQEGGEGFFAKFEDYDFKLWNLAIDVNLNSNFLITQIVGKHMKDNGSGSIINIASDVGVISPDHRIYQPNENYDYDGVEFNTPMSYSTSKAGIISMTKYLATYWSKVGIRVNSISPAGVYRGQDDKFVEQLENCIPLGRMAQPTELKGAVAFLASDASSFITGHNLMVDGGRSIW
ncbi:MAG: SDR family oxidoreductase [Bacteriovoracaceae bacterium]|jgi:NAD(P)-dependent dehydrogenase (short-subunit alcohol dehydrogenase family)|nr:SDR family oxidoreductase [Bacteriovoracaceae bacterium]